MDCEQAISIEWHGECVVCKFLPAGSGSCDGTREEMDLIAAEAQKRITVLNDI